MSEYQCKSNQPEGLSTKTVGSMPEDNSSIHYKDEATL
jgi:hypothetical protein